ncbi:MAG TPA: protein kinase [Armatimonadota bacterium]|nr:protein kinase [Armatimonadota bacterium]
MTGRVIDARYEVLERVNEGSFFTIYKARDRVLDRTVALKVLSARFATNAQFVERLRAELSTAAALTHSGIARIYEIGEIEGRPYVATEFVRGTDLKERIRRAAPFALSDAVSLAIGLLQAVDYAHRAGTVHGDVTPYNVLITPELDVKVTDFGISRAAGASSLSHSNAVLRGVHYLAPEVAQGGEATVASDIYSVGVILFEMLTGTLPYAGDTPIAVALKHAQEPTPSARAVNPSVPRALDGIIAKAMAKDPAARYPSMLAMLRDLRRAEECIRVGRPLSWSPMDAEATRVESDDEEDALVEPRRRWDGWRVTTTILTFVVLALAAGLAGFFFTGFGLPKDVVVPDIVGKPRFEAEEMLRQVGLSMKVVQEQHSDQPANYVIYAAPEPGRQVTEGREIRVTLSRGPETVRVPDLLHTTLAEAKRVLTESGLKAGTIRERYDDVVPKGQVVAQDPGPDRHVVRGTSVMLTVSKGNYVPPEPVATPEEPAVEQPELQVAPPPPPPAKPQRREVAVEVPLRSEAQNVRIVVVEDGTEKVAYNAVHPSGDKFATTVETRGPATIRVYVGDELVREERVGGEE